MEENKNELTSLIDNYKELDKNEIIEQLNSDDNEVKNNALKFLEAYKEFKNKNYKDALKLFTELNNSYYLALMYLYGLGTKPKEKKAYKLLRDNLDDKVNAHLAIMLLNGLGCNKDLEGAYNLVVDEALNNDLKSMLILYKYYEEKEDTKHLNDITLKIINSNEISLDFAFYFNDIYLEVLLKNNETLKVQNVVKNALLNNDIKTYENAISYYYDNKQFKEIMDLYKKKVKVSKTIKVKIKNARRLYKAKKLDNSIDTIEQAKMILRTYHFKMFFLGSGFGCYIAFILLYVFFYLMYKNNAPTNYVLFILSMLFNLSSMCLLFFTTRIDIKNRYNLLAYFIIFNNIGSLLLGIISAIISFVQYEAIIPFKVIPLIVILIIHIITSIISIIIYKLPKKLKKEIENN